MADGTAPDPEAAIQSALAGRVAALSRGRVRADGVLPDAHLLDRGWLDSVSVVELLAFVEAQWGVVIPETRLAGRLGTLRALSAHVLAHRRSA